MRRPPCHLDERGRLDVKMTPMIDVVFLLLIFFICTASFRPPERILPTRLSLPGAMAAEIPPSEELADLDEVVVKLLWRNDAGRWRAEWRINDRDYARLAEVRAVLEAVRDVQPDVPVILDVEPDVPMSDVIDLYDLCLAVGLERVQFAASPEA